jgi:hypothetical protein
MMRAVLAAAAAFALVSAAAAQPPQEDSVLRREDVTTATVLLAAQDARAAWAQVRERPGIESHNRLADALRRYSEQVEVLLPERAAEQRQSLARALTLLTYAEVDRTDGEGRRLASTLELLDQEIGAALAPVAELRAEGARGSLLPPGWEHGPLAAPEFRRTLRGLPSRDLVRMAEARAALIERLARQQGRADRNLCAEVAELSRELVERAPELAPASREGFRDTLLRLDVLAENVTRAEPEGGVSHLRRQAGLLAKAVDEAGAYLAVNARD